MPSRFTFFSNAEEIKSKYPIKEISVDLYPYYNLKPTNRATGIIFNGSYQLVRMRWGFVKGKQFFKARAESVYEKPMFRKAFQEKRCLVLANGFFEWNKETTTSIPYYFTVKNEPLFSLAGLYNSYVDEEDNETKYQFAVITTDANDLVGKIFHRMPVIIPHNLIEKWLDPKQTSETLISLLKPFPDHEMDSWQVDPLPSRGDNGPDTIKPAGTSGLADFF